MRMEFSNIFNRTEMANPGASNALAATTQCYQRCPDGRLRLHQSRVGLHDAAAGNRCRAVLVLVAPPLADCGSIGSY